MADSTKRVEFHYLKSPMFRTAHVDGALGGISPSGFLNVALFSQRIVIPQRSTHEVEPTGALGRELEEERVGRKGITRELEVNLVMSIATATDLRDWLGKQITAAQKRKDSRA